MHEENDNYADNAKGTASRGSECYRMMKLDQNVHASWESHMPTESVEKPYQKRLL